MTSENRKAQVRVPDKSEPSLSAEVHEALLETADGRRMRFVAPSRAAVESTAQLMGVYAAQLRPIDPGDDVDVDVDQVVEAVGHAVRHIEDLVRGHDAYDVMSMLCQRLVPPDLALWSESDSSTSGSWAAAEVVALVLLGLGLPLRDPDLEVRTASVVPELAAAGGRVVELASLSGIARHSRSKRGEETFDAWAAMAFRLAAHETAVRGRQYSSIATLINDAVLRTPQTEPAFEKCLGFTYDDVLAVRQAIVDLVGQAHEQAWSALAAVGQRGGESDQAARAAAEALFVTPSQLRQITADRVAQEAGLDLARARAILDRFSLGPSGRSPVELVRAFVEGRNPMAGVAVLSAPGRAYLPLPGALDAGEIRRRCEAGIKGTNAWTKYGRARDKAVETLVADALSALLAGQALVHRNLLYREGSAADDLSATSSSHSLAPLAEVDCLLLLDGVALCVEVKAGDLRPRARQGGLSQLQGDLEKTVRDAAQQAERIRRQIVENQGLWLGDGEWLDLGGVRETYSLVVCLDDLGPIALSAAELISAGVLTQTHLPWVVSVHDLLVAQQVLDRPEHFLTYLRRRTNRDAAMWISGADELDLLMWFLAGGFYFVADPDRIHAEHPGSKTPTAHMRREYAEQGLTVVGTFTDPLDAYYYWAQGDSSQEVPCPRRPQLPPLLQGLVDSLRSNNTTGWLRAGADLNGYSEMALQGITANIEHILKSSQRDGHGHTLATVGADDTGRWLYIFASGPSSAARRDHLEKYLAAKKHQGRADRALGIHLNADGSPLFALWLDNPPGPDQELDELVRAMRLIPSDRAPAAIPPKAKAKNTSRGKAGRRKRRR